MSGNAVPIHTATQHPHCDTLLFPMSQASDPSLQILLTQLVQSTAQLAESSNRQNNKLDGMTDKLDGMTDKLDRLTDKLDILTDQVGRLTEQITAMDVRLDKILATTETQAEIAKIQAENVAQLMAMVTQKGNQQN